MFERFTEEARHVVVLAQTEARGLSHNYIGTEHILLGLIRVEDELGGEGPAPLRSLGVTLEMARARVTDLVGRSDEPSGGQIPFTPRAKKVLELALREALSLDYKWIGPEHILLGLAHEHEGMASRILLEFDADPEKVRGAVIRYLGDRPPQPSVRSPSARHMQVSMNPAWLDGLIGMMATLAGEIRTKLGREPDLGDLLLMIACAQHTPSGSALRDLGVDLDVLCGSLQRAREQQAQEREQLIQKISYCRMKRSEALAGGSFKEAAKWRDQERELSELATATSVERDALREARRRLGLPEPAPPTGIGPYREEPQ